MDIRDVLHVTLIRHAFVRTSQWKSLSFPGICFHSTFVVVAIQRYEIECCYFSPNLTS